MFVLDGNLNFLWICTILFIISSVFLATKRPNKNQKVAKSDNYHLELLKLNSSINELKKENEKLKAEIKRINSCIQYICDQCKIFY
ncbi:hypothetical protein EDD79_100970 [Serpentinicella alkaliphila]|uniref:Uncharacterized protein n=1 Tax=Serpentinicella alkaliphila TaxID=1734049 RepID=A0A4R2TQ95_9FIRM|nr:hypothetical protein EDD79_100970 [Serpentinicella alkaliphila]